MTCAVSIVSDSELYALISNETLDRAVKNRFMGVKRVAGRRAAPMRTALASRQRRGRRSQRNRRSRQERLGRDRLPAVLVCERFRVVRI